MLKKKLKRATTDVEKNGFETLFKDIAEQSRKLHPKGTGQSTGTGLWGSCQECTAGCPRGTS